ncbi:MAG TPA: DUF5615 family PIN-like protein [Thermoanaerobaculia bacterium]|nr:DUF5615 family PIN-like protein [Thermoanaerobaculia bacterium]
MRIRLYLDEDSMSWELIHALLARGLDVQSAADSGMLGYPDHQHLEYAASEGRVLYSGNVGDFHQLHGQYMASQRSHSGIVLAHRRKYLVGEQIRRLLKLTTTLSAESMRNRLEFLNSWG